MGARIAVYDASGVIGEVVAALQANVYDALEMGGARVSSHSRATDWRDVLRDTPIEGLRFGLPPAGSAKAAKNSKGQTKSAAKTGL